jgi:3'(2'), 5'-bisphosphate nucleotidase
MKLPAGSHRLPGMRSWRSGTTGRTLAIRRGCATSATEIAFTVAHLLGAEMIEMGSAGAKTMVVVGGEADIYLHAGGQYEWDSAAPAAVALASGLHASRLDGSPLRYNQPNPWLPGQIVCRPQVAAQVLTAIRAVAMARR